MKIRTVIADDEPPARLRLRALLGRLTDFEVVAECRNGTETREALARLAPDLALLDIEMPGLNGIEALEGVRRPLVVFVTAFDTWAVEAFALEAVDYLLKPYDDARFLESMERVRNRIGGGAFPEVIPVPERGRVAFVPVSELIVCEAARDYVRLYASNRSWLLRQRMHHLETMLDPSQFLRIHRSTIVRISAITELRHEGDGTWSVVLGGKAVYRIGDTWLARVRAALAG